MLVVAGMITGIVIEVTFASSLIIPAMMLGTGLLYVSQKHISNRRQWVGQLCGAGLLVLFGGVMGAIAMALQSTRMPDVPAGLPVKTNLAGEVVLVDGNADDRLRLWVKISSDTKFLQRGDLVRISHDQYSLNITPGDHISLEARLYPPPQPIFTGAPDYGLQARARGIVASGYATSPIGPVSIRPGPRLEESAAGWTSVLAEFRHRNADYIAANMQPPAGGIAAALLLGDRRFISDQTYDRFRQSGLAHLLAISGLHMGLLCFGVIGFARLIGALLPTTASRLPMHKICAVIGLFAGAAYVFASGMPISAIRAFLMASLVIAALLLDCLALTMRNVALACMVILLFNPLAVFTASFQLSFAATLGLVLWYESTARMSRDHKSQLAVWPWPFRYITALMITSLIAGFATWPFAAQHFGGVTIWGVAANILGIPLTGLWIMPAGLMAAVVHVLPLPQIMDDLSFLVMQTGILALVAIAEFFANQPFAGWRVIPPGYALLCLGLAGWLVAILNPMNKGQKYAGVTLVCLAVGLWGLKPLPDAPIMTRGNAPVLVIAGPNGSATTHYPAKWTPALSNFARDSIATFLAQDVESVEAAQGAPRPPISEFVIARDRRGKDIAIVTRKSGLTPACRSTAQLVVSFVIAKYPCRDHTPIIILPALPPGNHLSSFGDNGEIVMRDQ